MLTSYHRQNLQMPIQWNYPTRMLTKTTPNAATNSLHVPQRLSSCCVTRWQNTAPVFNRDWSPGWRVCCYSCSNIRFIIQISLGPSAVHNLSWKFSDMQQHRIQLMIQILSWSKAPWFPSRQLVNNRDTCVLRIPVFRTECLEEYSDKKFLSWTRVLKCHNFATRKQQRCLGA